MQGWKQKLRRMAGLGLIGGAVGAGLGVILGPSVWGSFGAFTAAGFGVVLGTLGERIKLDVIPLWQAGVAGVLVGALFPPATLLVVSPLVGATTLPPVLSASAVCGVLGGVLATTMTAVAKRSDSRAQLPTASDPVLVEPGTGGSAGATS